jgi:hypothetical protein
VELGGERGELLFETLHACGHKPQTIYFFARIRTSGPKVP